MCVCVCLGYKQAYLSQKIDVSEVKKALTARILAYDEAEKEVSFTAMNQELEWSAYSLD